MRIVRNPPGRAGRPVAAASVVTIGNFDGMHLGHQALVERCHELAGDEADVAAVTFEPLPVAFFRPEAAPARLSSVRDKLRRMAAAGVDVVRLLRFDGSFANLTAEAFVRTVLVDEHRARTVVVGGDFRFGRNREGDVALLRQLGERHGFSAEIMAPITVDGERVSSTRIRAALAAGDFERAAALLGRPFTMAGRVRRGAGLGRGFGYPTANVPVTARPCPLHGVFAVRSRLEGGRWQPGVASLGNRPTVGGGDLELEVHLFDTDVSLYGQRLETWFVRKLRDEAHFATTRDMVRQMHRDAAAARAVLGLPEGEQESA